MNEEKDDSQDEAEEEPRTSRKRTSKRTQFSHANVKRSIKSDSLWSDIEKAQFSKGVEAFGLNDVESIANLVTTKRADQIEAKLSRLRTRIRKTTCNQFLRPLTQDEHETLRRAYSVHSKDWVAISRDFLPQFSPLHIQRHFYENFNRDLGARDLIHSWQSGNEGNIIGHQKIAHQLNEIVLAGKESHLGPVLSMVSGKPFTTQGLFPYSMQSTEGEASFPLPTRRPLLHAFNPYVRRVYSIGLHRQTPTGTMSIPTFDEKEVSFVHAHVSQMVFISMSNRQAEIASRIRSEKRILQISRVHHPSGNWYLTRHFRTLTLFGLDLEANTFDIRDISGFETEADIVDVITSPFEPAKAMAISHPNVLIPLDLTHAQPSQGLAIGPKQERSYLKAEYGVHPQVVHVLSPHELLTFDMRMSHDQPAVCELINQKEDGDLDLMAFGRVPQKRFETCLLSNRDLILCDIRFPQSRLSQHPHALGFRNLERYSTSPNRIELALGENNHVFAYQTVAYPVYGLASWAFDLNPNNSFLNVTAQFKSVQFHSCMGLKESPLFRFLPCQANEPPKLASILGAAFHQDKLHLLASSYEHHSQQLIPKREFSKPALLLHAEMNLN